MSASSRVFPEGRFYFATLYLQPGFEEPEVGGENVSVRRPRRIPTMFDIATLALEHEVQFPYTLMEVFASRCTTELSVLAGNYEEACERMSSFRLLLYAEGVSPFVVSFCTNIPMGEFAGINARDSNLLRPKLPPEEREGVTTATHLVRAAAIELSLSTHAISDARAVQRDQVERALAHLDIWMVLCKREPALRFFQEAIISAPQVFSTPQAILHLWTGIEGLFPNVQSEVSFRIALYVACLEPDPTQRRAAFDAVKKAYGTRSRIAHGAHKSISLDDWGTAWGLTMAILRSILVRQHLPSESELMDQVLGAALSDDS